MRLPTLEELLERASVEAARAIDWTERARVRAHRSVAEFGERLALDEVRAERENAARLCEALAGECVDPRSAGVAREAASRIRSGRRAKVEGGRDG
jgi:hypothetical protein